jgi:hypothetical protein
MSALSRALFASKFAKPFAAPHLNFGNTEARVIKLSTAFIVSLIRTWPNRSQDLQIAGYRHGSSSDDVH